MAKLKNTFFIVLMFNVWVSLAKIHNIFIIHFIIYFKKLLKNIIMREKRC